MSQSQQVFAKLFRFLKEIEAGGERARHSFNFSSSGRDQNLKFNLYFNRAERGKISYELLETGEISMARNMMLAGRDVILPKDVENVREQMEVLEVSPVIADALTAIVAGLRAMEVSAPVFTLSQSNKRIGSNEIVYVFGIAAYVLNDSWEPIGRIMFSMDVFKMSPLERTAIKLREAEDAKRANGEPALDIEVAEGVVKVGSFDTPQPGRYSLGAMLQPDSVAMKADKAKKDKGVLMVRDTPLGGSYEGKARHRITELPADWKSVVRSK